MTEAQDKGPDNDIKRPCQFLRPKEVSMDITDRSPSQGMCIIENI